MEWTIFLSWVERAGAVCAFLGVLLMADKFVELVGRERVKKFLKAGIGVAAVLCGLAGLALYVRWLSALDPEPKPVGLLPPPRLPGSGDGTLFKYAKSLGGYVAFLVPAGLASAVLHDILIGRNDEDWVRRLWYVGLGMSLFGCLCGLVAVFGKS
jgi:hypothetical protein